MILGTVVARVSGQFDRFASSAVLMREAARTSRRWQTYAARTGFSGALLGVLLLGMWAAANLGGVDPANMSWVGRSIFIAFASALMMMAICLAPLVTSAALIEEAEDRTLEMLVLSKLLPAQILAGKVLSRILLLLTVVFGAMPVMAMVVTMGGVAPQAVVAVAVHTLVAIVLMGTLGAFFGLFTRSPLIAMAASAAYALPMFVLLPVGYTLTTGNISFATHFSLFSGPAATDWTSPVALLSFVPSLVVMQVIGTRLFDLKVSHADVRRAFSAQVWGTRTWIFGLIFQVITGVSVLPVAALGAWFAQHQARSVYAGWVTVASVAVVWAWWVGTATVATWALLRIGVDVVDAMDAIVNGGRRGGRARRPLRVWANPVAWREARPAAWGSNGMPVLVSWLLLMLGMFQTGWWVIPGGSLAIGVMNTAAALGLAAWLTTRSIEEERRSGALDVLLTTTLPSWRILLGKVAGVAVPTLPLLVLSFPFFALGVAHVHMFDLGQVPFVELLLRGILTWVWTLPLWGAVVVAGLWTALRSSKRNGLILTAGLLTPALAIPAVAGRLFPEVALVALPARLVAPPLAGGASLWTFLASILLWSALGMLAAGWVGFRIRRWLAHGVALLVALALASPALAQPVPDQDGFLVEARPLADGMVRAGAWAAVRLRVANLQQDARAQITLTERSGTDAVEYGRTVDLPGGSVKDVVVLYRPNSSVRDRTLTLTAGRRRAEAVFSVDQARPQEATVAVIGEDLLGIQGIREAWGRGIPGPQMRVPEDAGRRLWVGLVDPAALPAHSAGWQAFDQVVWHRADPSALAPAEVDALKHWVADGGHLVLTVAENWQALQGSGLGPLLPLRFTGTEDRVDLGGLLQRLGGAAPTAPVPMAVGDIEPGTGRQVFTRLRTDEGQPLLVTATWGLGTVTAFLADPNGSAFRRNVPADRLWRKVLALPASVQDGISQAEPVSGVWTGLDGTVPLDVPESELEAALHADPPLRSGSNTAVTAAYVSRERPNHADERWSSAARDWLSDIPGVAPIPMSWLLAFSALYLFIIGPLDGMTLRLLKREPWTWVTFPLTIVVFTSVALIGTTWVKGSEAVVSAVEVVDLLPSTGLWRAEGQVSVFATQSTRVGIATGHADGVISPPPEVGYTRNPRFEAGLGPAKGMYTADTWTLGYTKHAWVAPAPGEVRIEAIPGGWSVTNAMPFPLRDARLASQGHGHKLGTLQPGERVEVHGPGPIPVPDWEDDWLLDLPSTGRARIHLYGATPVLVAEIDSVTTLSLEGVRPTRRSMTRLRVPAR